MEKKGFWLSLFGGRKTNDIVNEDVRYVPSEGVMDVKVLGPGCAKCLSTFKVVEKVVRESGLNIALTEVTDIEEIMSYNIMQTPALVVDGRVVIKGHVPSESEVKTALGL